MPEGPEVASFADDLHEILSGQQIKSICYDFTFTHFKNLEKIKKKLTVEKVFAHGKKIVFAFTNGSFLLSFLGLEGSWFQSTEDLELTNTILFQMITTDLFIYYKDTRHFGSIEFIENYDKLNQRLDTGLDLLNGEDSPEDWERVIQEAIKRHRRPLATCEFLLEQRYVMGIGNYLRAEILYWAKINPFKEINLLTKDEIKRICHSAKKEIQEAYRSRGATLRTYKDFHGREGGYKTKIYGHNFSPEGLPILKNKDKNGRTVWFVDLPGL